ncbi:small integral membrane protein 12 [Belonocnema kinseyi]|uniref:small integral membrane protein 12 n=1 Tax=Belonocnema kinseyi TaxID=2817044 RepID=UPI00143D09A9|nr:small integral membrane protein 12 [Belonocnema kinseyi]
MWPLVAGVIRRYIPILTFPVALVVGFIGYHIEGKISRRYTPSTPSISEQRMDRTLETVSSENEKAKPKIHSPLEVNLSPSLQSRN